MLKRHSVELLIIISNIILGNVLILFNIPLGGIFVGAAIIISYLTLAGEAKLIKQAEKLLKRKNNEAVELYNLIKGNVNIITHHVDAFESYEMHSYIGYISDRTQMFYDDIFDNELRNFISVNLSFSKRYDFIMKNVRRYEKIINDLNSFNTYIYSSYESIKNEKTGDKKNNNVPYYIEECLKILNLNYNFTKIELKHAYRTLAKMYHTDVETGDREKFEKVQESYETLKEYLECS